jgi:hypothetical protein
MTEFPGGRAEGYRPDTGARQFHGQQAMVLFLTLRARRSLR